MLTRFLPESIRWQLSNNKAEEARRVLTEVAQMNGKDLPPGVLEELQEDTATKTARHYTVLDCLRTWKMARLSLNVWFNWCVTTLTSHTDIHTHTHTHIHLSLIHI